MFEIFQVTAEYSNAVLVAIMPYISDFAKNLDLPITQPITPAHVRFFGCSPRSDHIGGRVFLTNGHSFTFTRGAVVLYRSPSNYFSLQDPNRIPEFYGTVRISKDEAVQIAREALKKLGYTDSVLHFDRAPKVTPPLRSGTNYVARYRVEWLDPDQYPSPGIAFVTADVEVDASNGQVHMLGILSKNARRPDPKIDIRPPVMAGPPQSQPVGGTKVIPVSDAYARAFLEAILPQLSDYVEKTGVDVKIPVTTDDVDMPHYSCGLVKNDPSAIIYLKSGDRFVYCRGQIVQFEAHDSYRRPEPNRPFEDKPAERFYGPVKVSEKQALSVVRKALNELGYPAQITILRKPPQTVPPRKDGTNYFARYFFNWWERDEDLQTAIAEVDATTGRLKAIYINDRTHTNIWRQPPKIDVPLE